MIKTKSSIQKTDAQTTTVSTLANTDLLRLNIKIAKEGKVVQEQRGKSFTANFARILGQMMSPGSLVDPSIGWTPGTVSSSTHSKRDYHMLAQPLAAAAPAKGQTIRAGFLTAMNGQNITFDISANGSATLGTMRLTEHSVYAVIPTGIRKGIYEVESFVTTDWPTQTLKLVGLNADPSDPVGFWITLVSKINPDRGSGTTVGEVNRIEVGSNNTPTGIDDFCLYETYRDSDITPADAPSVTAPVVAGNTARIAISSTFTNNSGEQKTIREIGLYLRCIVDSTSVSGASGHDINLDPAGNYQTGGTYNWQALCARDVIDSLVTQAGESFTVIYEILISVAPDLQSGVLENFADLLYRQLDRASRTVRDLFNTNHTALNQVGQMWVVNQDVLQAIQLSTGNYLGYDKHDYGKFGILLGSDESDIDVDDVFLRNGQADNVLIANGTQSAQLLYHKTYLVDFELTGTEAVCVFERFVENKSGAAIEVKQVGFSVASARAITRPTLIARNNLGAESFTIADGAFYRIRYKIGVAISP